MIDQLDDYGFPQQPRRDPWSVVERAVPFLFVLAAVALIVALLLAAPSNAHEWYFGAESPRGGRCCDDRDCAPVDARLNQETLEIEIYLNGRWWRAEEESWFKGASPDGSWHGCMRPHDSMPRCVWGGAGV